MMSSSKNGNIETGEVTPHHILKTKLAQLNAVTHASTEICLTLPSSRAWVSTPHGKKLRATANAGMQERGTEINHS